MPHQGGDQRVERRLLGAHHVQVPHRAAHDAAQHVAPAVAGGQNAVCNQEARAAQVVSHNAMASLERAVDRLPCHIGAGLHQRTHHVDVVVVVLALHDGHEALEAHTRIDRRAWQRRASAGRVFVVLHEDQVPDLNKPVPILIGAARRTARDTGSVVIKDLATGAAWAGVAHAPEIVGRADPDDALIRQAGDLAPQRRRVFIIGIDGDQQLIRVDPELPRQQRPSIFDCNILKIVAETEISEHLEERMVPGRVADVVQVVMLAPCAHALLRGRGGAVRPCLLPRKNVLELDHAAIGEQQCRVIQRHK